ncbi:MAG: glycosyl transferase [Armatimonadetes bacterium RBG_16_58_9]|nr:MAG: glycosyl transferase [Armatimonadetes bacterium RBG_16_58_9]
MDRIAVLIAAFNEEDLIGETVSGALTMPGIDEVVVIDDGSDDDTPFVAYDAGARVIQLDENSGKGAALNRGFADTEADIYLLIDADLGASAAETHRLLEPITANHADMSIAVLRAPPGHKGGFGLVKKLAAWGIRKYGGKVVTAPISGQRAIRRRVLDDVGGFENGFGVEVALTIDALRKGYRVVEVPLPLTHRTTGRNLAGFAHRGRQFVDVARAIWRRRR